MEQPGTLHRLLRQPLIKKYVAHPLMAVNEWMWTRLPSAIVRSAPGLAYGRILHRQVQGVVPREQNTSTCFLRNRAELDFLGQIAARSPQQATLRMAVLGCSTGAEAYCAVASIQAVRPDLRLEVQACDIDEAALARARSGRYPSAASELHKLTPDERRHYFVEGGDGYCQIREPIGRPIRWHLADALSSELADVVGANDIVIANRFMCHMQEPQARRCFENIAGLLQPGGFLFVSGLDLDVREEISRKLRLTPLTDQIEELHAGDSSLTDGWPFHYWGLEPMDRSRVGWEYRYSVVFRTPESS